VSASDVVAVSVTSQASRVQEQGFGIPLILSPHTKNTDRIRFYTSVAGLAADGFATTDPEYLAMSALFSADKTVQKVAVGRRANRPTMKWRLIPTAANLAAYAVKLGALTATFTSDSTATVAEITAGLKTAIDALAISGVTTTDNTTSLDITLAVGAWIRLRIPDATGALINVAQTHTDPGVGADLDAILLVDNTWYGVMMTTASSAEIAALAVWTEANKRFAIQQTQDSECENHASSGASDIMATLHTAAYKRTSTIYHRDNGAFADAAWLGCAFPNNPGSITFKFKTLNGVEKLSMTPTQAGNVAAKFGNVYTDLAGTGATSEGVEASGQFMDITRDTDWIATRIQTELVTLLLNALKVPFTNGGIAQVEARVRKVAIEAEKAGVLAPGWSVTAPDISDISGTDKANRVLNGVELDGTYAGALHKINITAALSV
jgi:hypothetical protein